MIDYLLDKYPFFYFITGRRIFLKFVIVGGFCGILDLLLIYFFTDIMNVWYIYSGIISFILVSVVSFFLNKIITFKNKDGNYKNQYLGYLLIITGGIMINNFFLYVFTDMLGLWYVISRIFSSLIALFWNYRLNKVLIFQKK